MNQNSNSNDAMNEVKTKATETFNNFSNKSKEFVEEYNTKNSNYLVNGEEIIIKAKWSKIPFIIAWGMFFIIFFITTINYPGDYLGPFRFGDLVLKAWPVLIIICILSIFLFVQRRELVVTNKKLYGRIGLIGTKQFIIPLKKVNYISVKFSIIGRLLNSATVVVYTGSLFGIKFKFISNSNEIKDELEKLVYKNI